MSKLTEVVGLIREFLDDQNDIKYRLEAYIQAEEIRKGMKAGWSKFGIPAEESKTFFGIAENLEIALVEIALEQEQTQVEETEDMNAEKTVRALLNKTIENGCTPDEEKAAYVKADELTTKYNLGNVFVLFASKKATARLWPAKDYAEASSKPETDSAKAEATETAGGTKKPEHGAIGRLCQDLILKTDLTYEEIVLRVRAAFPNARTSTRSLASVAKDLRKAGVKVPNRRKAKKV